MHLLWSRDVTTFRCALAILSRIHIRHTVIHVIYFTTTNQFSAYHTVMNQYISRTSSGDRFIYMRGGKRINDARTLDRIASLAIPPAWRDVRIAVGARAKVQAEGYDAAGRKQYIYHPAHTARQAAAKFDRITHFAQKLPALRKRVENDLRRKRFDRRKVIACAVHLMDETYFRVGNQQYSQQTAHYGLTTLRSKHLAVRGHTVTFDFVGKSGQQQHKELTDQRIARIIRKLNEMPGYEIFRYYAPDGSLHNLTSSDINEYIKQSMGDDYSAKDFRTWGGTLLATMELAKLTRPATQSERKKSIAACVKRVAKKLGNTPAIARGSYIHPRILSMFEESDGIGDVYATIKGMKPRTYLNSDEQCALKLLSS